MCGIVGYIGNQSALEIILSGLQRLEYRGYDSAGVAIYEDDQIHVHRALGKLIELRKKLDGDVPGKKGSVGIGHTRWATHGKPSENNAHPHSAGRVSLIHNGIVENYIELREELKGDGCVFSSETDTEIAAHLFNRALGTGLAPFEALKDTCGRLRGSYAFLAIDSDNPDRIMVAKNATPIVIGVGEGEMFIASDIPAILGATRKVIILEDGDIAELSADGIRVENDGKEVKRPVETVTWDPVTAQKGGYKHFMLKEIHEQALVLAETFRGRLNIQDKSVFLEGMNLTDEEVSQIDRVVFVACGTSWHACLVAKFYFESLTGIPCEVDYASEFRYRTPVYSDKTLFICVSQSGETADTLAAIELVREHAKTLAICNVLGSSIARRVGDVVFTHAGPEISVASTKAFTTQIVSALVLALWIGERRDAVSAEKRGEIISQLVHLPAAIDEAVKVEEQVKEIAKKFHQASDFLYLGRGSCYPVALEGALKLKEISYIHAEGYPAGEMKHGPIALIDEHMPVVVALQNSPLLFEKTLSNLREVHARAGRIIAVTDVKGNAELAEVCEEVIEVPYLSEELSPLLLTVPMQLLAYYVAVLNGTDVDLPRNLAKSVTVE